MKVYGGVEIYFHSLLMSSLEGERSTSRYGPLCPATYRTGEWVDPRDGLDKFFSIRHHAATAYVRTGCTAPRIPPSTMAQAVTFLICIQEVTGSHLGQVTDYPDRGISLSSSVFQASNMTIPALRSQPINFQVCLSPLTIDIHSDP